MSQTVTSDNESFQRVKQRLCALGASSYVLSRPEVSRLTKLLYFGEKIEAFIYGANAAGWGMLVATDQRLLFVNKRLMNLIVNEVPYPAVSSIDHSVGPMFAKVAVRTRQRLYDFRKVNRKCAEIFAGVIQVKLLENQAKEGEGARAVAAGKNLVESMDYENTGGRVERWVNG